MFLREAIDSYLLTCRAATRDGHKIAQEYRPVLTRFAEFACNIPVSELEPIHILMFISAEKIVGIRQGESPSSKTYLRHYKILSQFILWLERQRLAFVDLKPFLLRIMGKEKTDGDENPRPKDQHPPSSGGCWVYNRHFILNTN